MYFYNQERKRNANLIRGKCSSDLEKYSLVSLSSSKASKLPTVSPTIDSPNNFLPSATVQNLGKCLGFISVSLIEGFTHLGYVCLPTDCFYLLLQLNWTILHVTSKACTTLKHLPEILVTFIIFFGFSPQTTIITVPIFFSLLICYEIYS